MHGGRTSLHGSGTVITGGNRSRRDIGTMHTPVACVPWKYAKSDIIIMAPGGRSRSTAKLRICKIQYMHAPTELQGRQRIHPVYTYCVHTGFKSLATPVRTQGVHLPWPPWHTRTPSTHGFFDLHFSSNIYFEVINPHTVGSLTIPRASIKWV